MKRRTILTKTAVLTALPIAGCTTGNGGDGGGSGETATPTETATATSTDTMSATATEEMMTATPMATSTSTDTPTPTKTPSPTSTETASSTPTETPSPTATKADTTVEMKNTAFTPVKAEVPTGGTVKWVNKDGYSHDVTSAQFSDGAASWDFKQTLGSDESTTYTFESNGFYEYKCTIHGKGTMCGVILVGGVSYGGSLPCQDDTSDDGGGY